MAKRLSNAGRNFVSRQGSWADALGNGVLMFFSGSQPADAESAYNANGGAPLVAFTETAGVITKETIGYGSLQITAGTATTRSIQSVKVGGIEILARPVTLLESAAPYTNTTTALIAAINESAGPIKFSAARKTAGSDVIIVKAPKGSGTRLNAALWTVVRDAAGSDVAVSVNNSAVDFGGTATYTSASTTTFPFAPPTAVAGYAVQGVAGVNLLNLTTQTTDGQSAKETAAWQGVAGSDAINTALGATLFAGFTSGTSAAGWFRWYGSMDDPELLGTPTSDAATKQYIRYDGNIATSGGDMTATGGTSIVYGATHTQNSFTINVPATQG